MKSEDIIRIEKINYSQDVFVIRWNMTYICNYNCDFCIQGNKQAHINKCKGESVETRTKICDNLIKFIETKLNGKYKSLKIFLIGGEITILKDFYDILKKIVECKFEGKLRIHITTNLSTNDKVLKKIYKLFTKVYEFPRILEISASYYKDYATQKEFIKKVSILTKKTNKNLLGVIFKNLSNKKSKKADSIRVNLTYPLCIDDDYYDYLNFKDKYKNKVRFIDFVVIREYKKSISESLKKKLEKNDNRQNIKVTFSNGKIQYFATTPQIGIVLDDGLYFKSKGYICDSGMNSINISNVGIVSRCTTCKEQTIIGDLKENDFKIPKDKMICPAERCACSYYGVIEKNNNV